METGNKIIEDLIDYGAISPDSEDKELVENVLGQHLNPILDKLKEVEEVLDTNSLKEEWTDDEVSMEIDWLYGKVYNIIKDLEKLK